MRVLNRAKIDHNLKFIVIVNDIYEEQLRAGLADRLDSAWNWSDVMERRFFAVLHTINAKQFICMLFQTSCIQMPEPIHEVLDVYVPYGLWLQAWV